MKVLEIATRGDKVASRLRNTGEYAIDNTPFTRLLGVRLPSCQVLAVKEWHEIVLRHYHWRRRNVLQFLDLDLAELNSVWAHQTQRNHAGSRNARVQSVRGLLAIHQNNEAISFGNHFELEPLSRRNQNLWPEALQCKAFPVRLRVQD